MPDPAAQGQYGVRHEWQGWGGTNKKAFGALWGNINQFLPKISFNFSSSHQCPVWDALGPREPRQQEV